MARPAANRDDPKALEYLEKGATLVRARLGFGDEQPSVAATEHPAGDSQVVEETWEDFPILGLITATHVVDDKSTGGFYRRWKSKSDYVGDLVEYLLSDESRFSGGPAERSHEWIERLADNTNSLSDFVIDAANKEVEVLDTEPTFAIQLHLWSASRQFPSVRRLLRESYRTVTTKWMSAYKLMFKMYGLRLREGFDEQRLAVILTAMLEGLAIRARVDPDSLDNNLFADAVMALFLGLLVRQGDSSTTIRSAFDQWLAAQTPGSGHP